MMKRCVNRNIYFVYNFCINEIKIHWSVKNLCLVYGAQVFNSRTNCRQPHQKFFICGLKSFSFLLFIVMTVENPRPCRYDVENGSIIVITFIDILGNSGRAYIQNWLTVISLNFKFNVPSLIDCFLRWISNQSSR